LGLFDLAIGPDSEMLDEAFTAASRASAAACIIDRQIDQITFGLGGWPVERRLKRNALRPDGLQDRLEDRQRHTGAACPRAK
jgi:hypothetical protein